MNLLYSDKKEPQASREKIKNVMKAFMKFWFVKIDC